MKGVFRHAFPLRHHWVYIYHIKPLIVFFFTEIDPLQTAGVDDWRGCRQLLATVDMPQGYIVQLRQGDGTHQQDVITPKHHVLFRAGACLADGNMPRQYGRNCWVE